MNENRKKIFNEYTKNKNKFIERSFLQYDRYYESSLIYEKIKDEDLKILDYGCGVGDYGFFLLNHGFNDVSFKDYKIYTDFVKFRLKKANLKAKFILVNRNDNKLMEKFDLVIFGEVLEHLKNPYVTVKACLDSKVKYIFTSSYPYRNNDKYWDRKDHLQEAKELQPKVRKLLEENYTYKKFNGQLRLWKIK